MLTGNKYGALPAIVIIVVVIIVPAMQGGGNYLFYNEHPSFLL